MVLVEHTQIIGAEEKPQSVFQVHRFVAWQERAHQCSKVSREHLTSYAEGEVLFLNATNSGCWRVFGPLVAAFLRAYFAIPVVFYPNIDPVHGFS